MKVVVCPNVLRANLTKLGTNVFANPSNGSFNFTFDLDKTAAVTLAIFGANGQLVSTLNAGQLSNDAQQLTWNGRNTEGSATLANGIYIAVARLDGQTVSVKKLVKE